MSVTILDSQGRPVASKGYDDRVVAAMFGGTTGESGAIETHWGTTLHNTDPQAIFLSNVNGGMRRINVRDAGYYDVDFNVLLGNGSLPDGRNDGYLRHYASDGTTIKRTYNAMGRTSGGYVYWAVSATIFMTAGDQLAFYNAVGGTGAVTYPGSNGDWSRASISKSATTVGTAPEPWTPLPLVNSHSVVAGWPTAAYRKKPDGEVRLRGYLVSGGGGTGHFATVPASITPSVLHGWPALWFSTGWQAGRVILYPIGHASAGRLIAYSQGDSSTFNLGNMHLDHIGWFLD